MGCRIKSKIPAIEYFLGTGLSGDTPLPEDAEHVFHFDAANTATMLQESRLLVPITAVTTDGDNIGTMYSLGRDASFGGTSTSVNRPLLSTIGGVSCLEFRGAGFSIPNSRQYWGNLMRTTLVFTIFGRTRLAAGTDGVRKRICYNMDASATTDAGHTIERISTNKFRFLLYKAVSGQSIISATSAANITAATGWLHWVITVNGSGASRCAMYLNSTTPELFTVGTGVAATLPDADTSFYADTGQYMAEFGIDNYVWSAGEISAFMSKSVSRTNVDQPRLCRFQNYNDSARGFSDLAATAPIADNESVGRWVDSIDGLANFTLANSKFHAPAALATSPVYQALHSAGRGAITYNAVDQNLGTDLENFFSENGGVHTSWWIGANTNSGTGSRFWGGNLYGVLTAFNYPAAFFPGIAYFTFHFGNSTPGTSPVAIRAKNQGLGENNMIVLRRIGNIVKIWNTLYETAEGTTTDEFSVYAFGDMVHAAAGNWWIGGHVCEQGYYSGALTDAQVRTLISTKKTEYSNTI